MRLLVRMDSFVDTKLLALPELPVTYRAFKFLRFVGSHVAQVVRTLDVAFATDHTIAELVFIQRNAVLCIAMSLQHHLRVVPLSALVTSVNVRVDVVVIGTRRHRKENLIAVLAGIGLELGFRVGLLQVGHHVSRCSMRDLAQVATDSGRRSCRQAWRLLVVPM